MLSYQPQMSNFKLKSLDVSTVFIASVIFPKRTILPSFQAQIFRCFYRFCFLRVAYFPSLTSLRAQIYLISKSLLPSLLAHSRSISMSTSQCRPGRRGSDSRSDTGSSTLATLKGGKERGGGWDWTRSTVQQIQQVMNVDTCPFHI